ncbi:hypothetical protein MNBD_GAMMA04-1716 [hydrothermal vent metagenome]|uniref:Uncharacterized protein n=1 Tax=hydrothermal vent metagenome TaxID=652676 RepID=A0A3B0VYZ7_9ZZZZ
MVQMYVEVRYFFITTKKGKNFMSCSPIIGLRLDTESKAALERIKGKQNFTKLLSSAITVGVFNNIFTKNKALVVALNITQTDWALYSEAMSALPIIQKHIIQKEIDLMIIHYQTGKYDYKHIQFWKGMKHGCR